MKNTTGITTVDITVKVNSRLLKTAFFGSLCLAQGCANILQPPGRARGRLRRWSVAAAVGLALPMLSHAGELAITPQITVGEIYTDNLFLSPPGSPDKDDEFITEIQPGFKLNYVAPQLTGNIDYNLQGLIYAEHSGENHVYNQLDANATLAAVPNFFYIDGTTIYDQQIINPEEPAGSSNIFGVNNNRTNVSATTLSPYLMHDFGPVGIATLRYAYGRTMYSGRNIPDANSNTVLFSLARQPQYGDLTYNISYLHQRLDPDRGRDVSFEQAQLGLQYQVGGHTQLLANVGKENTFRRDGTVDELGSTFWSAGFRLAYPLNDFKVLVGHRFYGRSYDLEWRHEAARATTHLEYTETPTDFNRMLLNRSRRGLVNSQLPEAVLPSLLDRHIFILKRVAATATYHFSRSDLTVNLYDERREYVTLTRHARAQGGHIDWRFNLGLRDAFTPSFGYRRYRFRDGQTNYTTRGQLDWTHNLSRSMTMDVAVRTERRNANEGREFRVNTALVELTKLF